LPGKPRFGRASGRYSMASDFEGDRGNDSHHFSKNRPEDLGDENKTQLMQKLDF